ncbi:hypothetical protein ABT112_33910 [Streptomyces sp. NPDC002055]|uniref:hypothetical protein n=1 Tax=Streptomyces sp. NPDC002055 TaxID=3154534 RepID=UPI00332967EB
MSQMRRGLMHGVAWTLATGAAVTLSWWGVRTVLAGTAYDPPRALPIQGEAAARGGGPAAEPQSSSTHRPKPSPTAAPTSRKPPEKPSPPASRAPRSTPAPAGNVKSYNVAGGRVVFDLSPSSASLVSATPDAGWQMQVWKQSEWIRVNFTQGADTTSVFCTWNGHPPTVQTD